MAEEERRKKERRKLLTAGLPLPFDRWRGYQSHVLQVLGLLRIAGKKGERRAKKPTPSSEKLFDPNALSKWRKDKQI